MAGIDISFEKVRKAARKLENDKEEFQGQLKALDKYIDDLVGRGFVTESASEAFNERFKDLTSGLNRAIKGLEGMSSFLDSAADGMQQYDRDLAKKMRS